jgi:penicillin V acylase-like amidase (Ntn superfamily)
MEIIGFYIEKKNKMDISIYAFIVSGCVAAIQIYTFFDGLNSKKLASQNVFAKADLVKTDLDTIRTSIDVKLERLFRNTDENLENINELKIDINLIKTFIAVLDNKLENDKEFINKLSDKLDKILERI